MEATAKLKFKRLSPRRTRLVADAIRGKSIEEALNILEFMSNKPSFVISKVLKSAVANAGNKEGMDTETLFISKLLIDEGPMWKRFMPRAMGRATVIRKKTSHINLVVSDGYKPKGKKKKITKKIVVGKKKTAAKKKTVKKSAVKEESKKETKTEAKKKTEKKEPEKKKKEK